MLYGHRQRPVGIHFRGPTFESFDGSNVVGALEASVPAPTPGAVPWLLLAAVSNQGDGVLGQVDFVHRLETRGGVAPAGACDRPGRHRGRALPGPLVFYAADLQARIHLNQPHK